MPSWKTNISFALIDTLEPGNIGASARALKNLGFSSLHLVRPRKYPAQEAGWFAHGAEDVLEKARVHDDLATCLADSSVVVGATRRKGKKRGFFYPVREAAEKIRMLARKNKVVILFGREDRGLTNDEIARCSFVLNIPADPRNPSFNLAQAVLIVAYELSSAERSAEPSEATPRRVIGQEEFDRLFDRLQGLMIRAGYCPRGIRDKEEEIMRDLKRILGRTELSPREARMLHGILTQMEEGFRKITRAAGDDS